MLRRSFWFVTGVVTGGVVTVRALRRKPTGHDLRHAAVATGADVMSLAARAVRPNGNRRREHAR
ncbi:MAG TPA: hypothetical protein VJA46_14595 [Acidimicrobiia bacterium]|nr:hypothetical protein [Acidimicrobiia bacterium]